MSIPNRIAAAAWILAVSSFLPAQSAPPQKNSVNQASLAIHDFRNRVDAYVKLRKQVQATLPSPPSGSSAENVRQYQVTLAQRIRAERSQARPGDVFTPAISEIFRKLIATPFKSNQGKNIRASMGHAEPVQDLKLQVNQEYPQTSPLQSTPPTLLLDLPDLPAELEYRIVGHELILFDSPANLIVDLLPDASPAVGVRR